jgi:vanillate O-demethylase monooxygenase subunit
MYLKNAWYVAGWTAEFPEGKLVARGLLNDAVVIYRKRDGGLVALQDRCAHRLAPLSVGRLEGDDLRCMYHGLNFDPSGKCIEIPGSPEKIPAAVYPSGTAARLNGEAPTQPPLSESFSCQAVTPLTDSTSRYFFSWGPRARAGADAIADGMLKVAHQAFAEDKAIIEAQQKVIARSPGVNPMPTPADRAVIAFQRILNRMMQAEAA